MKFVRNSPNSYLWHLLDDDDDLVVGDVLLGMYMLTNTLPNGRIQARLVFNEVGNIF